MVSTDQIKTLIFSYEIRLYLHPFGCPPFRFHLKSTPFG
nr:MAG TPA: hypothetical protein [Bacteriophage sp.]